MHLNRCAAKQRGIHVPGPFTRTCNAVTTNCCVIQVGPLQLGIEADDAKPL